MVMQSFLRFALLCAACISGLTAPNFAANPNLVIDPSFDDFGLDFRPRGWRAPCYEQNGEVKAIPCVTEGKEGENTHTGPSALQFVFPPGIIPPLGCTWSFDPATNGIDVHQGDYTASCWVKTANSSEKLEIELWDTNVPVEDYASGGQAIALKVLEVGELPSGEWTKVELPFSVSRDGVRLGVSFHLKDATPDSQVFIDDLEVIED